MGRKKKKPKRISEDIKTVVEIIAAITFQPTLPRGE